MRFLKLEKILQDEDLQMEIVRCVRKGYVFFYPTDTVYGIGCDATKTGAVGRIRSIKDTEHPFSVIAPSKDWIRENLILSDERVLEKLPGPYTLILKKKNASFLEEVCASNSLGIRIPNHPLTGIIQASEKPFVTTSANVSGQSTITNPGEIHRDMARELDIIIDAGNLAGNPSTIIDCTRGEPETRER